MKQSNLKKEKRVSDSEKSKSSSKELNPSGEQLTTEALKKFEGLANLSDDEADNVVSSQKQFALILSEWQCQNKLSE